MECKHRSDKTAQHRYNNKINRKCDRSLDVDFGNDFGVNVGNFGQNLIEEFNCGNCGFEFFKRQKDGIDIEQIICGYG